MNAALRRPGEAPPGKPAVRGEEQPKPSGGDDARPCGVGHEEARSAEVAVGHGRERLAAVDRPADPPGPDHDHVVGIGRDEVPCPDRRAGVEKPVARAAVVGPLDGLVVRQDEEPRGGRSGHGPDSQRRRRADIGPGLPGVGRPREGTRAAAGVGDPVGRAFENREVVRQPAADHAPGFSRVVRDHGAAEAPHGEATCRRRQLDRECRLGRRSGSGERVTTVRRLHDPVSLPHREQAVVGVGAADRAEVPTGDTRHRLPLPGCAAVRALEQLERLTDRVEGRGVRLLEAEERLTEARDLGPRDSAVRRALDAPTGGREAGRLARAEQVRGLWDDRHGGAAGERLAAVCGREHGVVAEHEVPDGRRREREGPDPRRTTQVVRRERKPLERRTPVIGPAKRAAAAHHDPVRRAGHAHPAEVEGEPGHDARPARAGVRALEQRPEGAGCVTRRSAADQVGQVVRSERRIARVPAGVRCVHTGRGSGDERQRRRHSCGGPGAATRMEEHVHERPLSRVRCVGGETLRGRR